MKKETIKARKQIRNNLGGLIGSRVCEGRKVAVTRKEMRLTVKLRKENLPIRTFGMSQS
jgi:hypothetical protein